MVDLDVRGRFVSARLALAIAVALSPLASAQINGATPPNKNTQKTAAPGQPDPDAITPQNAPPASVPAPPNASAQNPIDFESHGMEYEALTREGITVMFARLPPHIKDYNIIQVTVTNGSLVSWTVKPGDFTFVRQDGTVLPAVSADEVIESLLAKASRSDVIKLQLLYEDSIYALSNFRSTNGYEKRREAAMAQFVKPGFKAAVAASAITLSPIKLNPGDGTDGAVFFENRTKEKALGPGRFIAHTCGEIFQFLVYPEAKLR
jgi:hypothetical protein